MSLIIKKNDIEVSKNLFILIYGQPASYKSTTALSAEKPLLFDFERGCQRINREWQCDTVQPETYSQLLEVLEKENLSPYSTLVFDTLLALNDLCMDEILKTQPTLVQKDGSPSLKAYGQAKIKFKALVEKLASMNKTIIFVAHSIEQKNQDEIEIRTDSSSSAIREITKKLDVMAYISVVGNKKFMNFKPTSRYYAKPIQGVPDQLEIPVLEEGQANTFLQDKVINPAIEYRKKGAIKKVSYDDILKQARKIIADKGVTEESKAELRKLPKVEDSQEQIKNMIDEWNKKNVAK